MNHLVITVFAADKPGQVERIADCIAAHGGNWLESRMSRMAGQFAGILRVGVPAETYEELLDALKHLEGIQVMFAESGIEQSCTWKPIAMELVGNDRPGIVRDITRVLTEQGVSLERFLKHRVAHAGGVVRGVADALADYVANYVVVARAYYMIN